MPACCCCCDTVREKIFGYETVTVSRADVLQPISSGPWYLSFFLGQIGNLSFFIEIICWAPWISQVQSTGLPSIFPKAEPCLESEVILFNTPDLHTTALLVFEKCPTENFLICNEPFLSSDMISGKSYCEDCHFEA